MITVVQANIYRFKDNALEYLLLKRTRQDGGFWQPVTGTLEKGEELTECLVREVTEETGLTELLHISPIIYEYDWTHKKYQGHDVVFAIQVSGNQAVVVNPAEHTDSKWLSFDAAMNQLYWPGNKESLVKVREYIRAHA